MWAGVAHVWLGVSYILPFHAILFSVDALGSRALFVFSAAYFGPCLAATFVLAVAPLRAVPPAARVLVAYVLFAVALVTFAGLLQTGAPLWLYGFVVCWVGALDGVAQSTMLSLAAAGEPTRVRQMLLGNAVAGAAVGCLKMAVKASLLQDTRLASSVFFVLCAALMGATVPVYLAVAPADASAGPPPAAEAGRHASAAALAEMAPYPLLTFGCFLSTLVVFPGIASEFAAAVVPRAWVSVLMLQAFNLGDLAGRALAGAEGPARLLLRDARVTGACVGLRVALLLPLFVLALPAVGVIRLEAVPLLGLFLFGLSGGLLVSLCMSAGAAKARDKQLAGAVLTFVALSGLFLGSLVSFAIGALLN